MATRSTRFAALSLSVLLGLVGVVGCTEDEDPADISRRRVAERLEETFSGDRAGCIVGQLDDPTIEAMLADGPLLEGEDLDAYSAAVRSCLTDESDGTDGNAAGPR